jgi:uncharacterized protein (TIGR02569 family)
VSPPPPVVLAAFGVTVAPRRMPGGRGETWRAGDIVLKPAEGAVSRWRSEVLSALPATGAFRVARPLPARDGGWLCAGWEAMSAVAGEAAPHRVDEIIDTGTAFHAAVAAAPRPSVLDERDDPWAYADRLAWGEPVPAATTAVSPLLEPLFAARRPVRTPAQAVHGDLLGNVLFAPGLPPAVIDWAPYWRPPGWAYAVAVVDALCWHGAPPELVDRHAYRPDWGQMLIRALIFRIATRVDSGWRRPPESAYRPVVDLVVAHASRIRPRATVTADPPRPLRRRPEPEP